MATSETTTIISPAATSTRPPRAIPLHHTDSLISTLVRGASKTTPETATPSSIIVVVLKLTDATNGALSLDFITVSNKSNFPNRHRHECRLISDNVNTITVTVTVILTITKIEATAVRTVLPAAR